MGKPESYPFLRISRQFGVLYADVLRIANASRFMVGGACILDGDVVPYAMYGEINRATNEQEAIRRGLIDWQTGEPTETAGDRFAEGFAATRASIERGARRTDHRFKL